MLCVLITACARCPHALHVHCRAETIERHLQQLQAATSGWIELRSNPSQGSFVRMPNKAPAAAEAARALLPLPLLGTRFD